MKSTKVPNFVIDGCYREFTKVTSLMRVKFAIG